MKVCIAVRCVGQKRAADGIDVRCVWQVIALKISEVRPQLADGVQEADVFDVRGADRPVRKDALGVF